MKTVPIIYKGPLPEIQIEIGPGRHIEAARGGKPVLVAETLAKELVERGDFIEGRQQRNDAESAQ